jgi:flagellar protein FliO/FliZ
MIRVRTKSLLTATIAVGVLLATTAMAAQSAGQPVPGALDTAGLLGSALRMVLSLGAVLAMVAILAWVAQRLRAGGRLKSGLIEIVSGVSLGAREKVVLLRIGQEQVLVGVSPAGMSALHVIKDASATPPFATYIGSGP